MYFICEWQKGRKGRRWWGRGITRRTLYLSLRPTEDLRDGPFPIERQRWHNLYQMFPYFCTASRVQLGCTPQNGVCVAIRHSWTMPYQSLSVTETLNQALRSLQACVYRNESLLLKKRKNSNRSHGIHVLYACVWRLKLSLLLLFAMREKQKKIKIMASESQTRKWPALHHPNGAFSKYHVFSVWFGQPWAPWEVPQDRDIIMPVAFWFASLDASNRLI